jgi:hypothetical protein
MHTESVLAAESNQIDEATGPPLSKSEMLAYKELGQSELLVQHTIGELLRCHRGKSRRKLQHDDFLDPGSLEASQLFIRTGEKSKIDVRGENLHRMWLKRHHERAPPRFSSRFHHSLQQQAMTEMVAVKIADGRDWMGTWTGIGEPTCHFQHRGQCRSWAASLAK